MRIAVLLLTALVSTFAAQSRPEPLALLKSVTQRYADAKSYHIEAVQEQTRSNDLSRQWDKELLTVIVAPDGRYRYEGNSGHGSGMTISDGTTRWVYHLDETLYTQTSVSTAKTNSNRDFSMEEAAALEAEAIMRDIRTVSARVKSAALLADQEIEVGGRKVKCYVVHIGTNDFKTRQPDVTTEETFWIEQSTLIIVKRERIEDSYTMLPPSGVHIPLRIETSILYPVVRLDEPEPPSSFEFTPPPNAKLVASFPTPMLVSPSLAANDYVGKPAPELQLRAADKKTVSLSAFRGKPVFIEFWATWCAPCVDLMPELKDLYSQTSKSVVWLSIDSDEDPDAATDYLSQEHIPWPNYHDEDGSLGKAFGRVGIPLGILIDGQGKVVFYKSGYEIAELRAAIAKMTSSMSGSAAANVAASR